MTRLLVNLLFFSFLFAFIAAPRQEKITLRLAGKLALAGSFLLALPAVVGTFDGRTLLQTYLELGPGNDHTMGVIYGVAFLYAAALCVVWSLSMRLSQRKQGVKQRRKSPTP